VLAFILRRMLQSVAVMAVVAFIAFALFNFTGDPISFMVGQDATAAEKAQLRTDLGLDQPSYVQFARFVRNALHGEFGRSLRQARKVSTLLKERVPATLELAVTAAVIALVFGIPLGVYTALRRQSKLAQALLAGSLIGVSLPTFLIGILLILVFAVYLGWLPSFGRGDTVAIGWWTTGFLTASGLKALILPAITLSLFPMTLIMRLVRAEMLEVLRTDYIKFARARGLTDRAIHFGHALKNTLVPVRSLTRRSEDARNTVVRAIARRASNSPLPPVLAAPAGRSASAVGPARSDTRWNDTGEPPARSEPRSTAFPATAA
jgi:peptide/nickel transport system permease protein